MELSFIISDASFDKKNKVSKIVSMIQNTSLKREKLIKANSPKDAEKEGLYQSIQLAIDNNIKKPILICDNKFAINEVRRESMQNIAYKSYFHYIQFLWLPRELTSNADKFTQIFSKDEQNMYNEYRKDKSKRIEYKENEINNIKKENLTYKGNLDNSKLLSDTTVNNIIIYRNIIQKEYKKDFKENHELNIFFNPQLKINNKIKLNGDIKYVKENQDFIYKISLNKSNIFILAMNELYKIIY